MDMHGPRDFPWRKTSSHAQKWCVWRGYLCETHTRRVLTFGSIIALEASYHFGKQGQRERERERERGGGRGGAEREIERERERL
jgi:hypothetical protein